MGLPAIVVEILSALLKAFGPALIRQHIDYWETARAAADAAELAKFGPEQP